MGRGRVRGKKKKLQDFCNREGGGNSGPSSVGKRDETFAALYYPLLNGGKKVDKEKTEGGEERDEA